MKRRTSITNRVAAYLTIVIFLFPDVSASARAIQMQSWKDFNVIKKAAELSHQIAYLGGHEKDELNSPSDDVFSFEVKSLDKNVEISFKSTESKSALGVSYNGQHYETQEKRGKHSVVINKNDLELGDNQIIVSSESQAVITGFRTSPTSRPSSDVTSLAEANTVNFVIENDSYKQASALTRSQAPAIPFNMSNVTRGAEAYRDQGIKGLISVKIGVNRELSVESLRQSKVMYFSKESKSWKEAHVSNIDQVGYMLRAEVPGGTDYFAALIKTPDMPEASAFMPTSISDLEPANPATGITMIQPPTVNQQGDASISYPLAIPAGRQGMTPQLALSYNSSGSSSWCGYGWNISTPSISVDTRWGVPQYDKDTETEVYSFNGENLHSENGKKANRPQLKNGEPEYPSRKKTVNSNGQVVTRFFQKIQGAYVTIERIGSSPSGYFWVVTDADQNKQYYGTKNGTQIDVNSLERDPQNGAISQWYLSRTEDKWGNYIDYSYQHISYSNQTGIKKDGLAVYPNEVTYTGHNGVDGNFKVVFNLNTNTDYRKDARVSMNTGFKIVDDQLLDNVSVYYKQQKIREFKLHYGYGDFEKTLLSSIEEFRNGQSFYDHTFNYNQVGQISFGAPQTIKKELFDHNLVDAMEWGYVRSRMHKLVTPSLLKTTQTKGWSFGGGAGLGLTPEVFPNADKAFTLSGKLGFSGSNTHDKYSMQDMNADGIPDIVYDKRGKDEKKYFPLTYQNGQVVIGGAHTIKSPKLFSNNSLSINTGFDFVLPFDLYSYGKNWNISTTTTSRYLVDYNGDGVLDQVVPTSSGSEVHFGILAQDGTLRFDPNSSNSLSPVFSGEAPIVYSNPDVKEFEIVRTWIAPATGSVYINSTPALKTGVSGDAIVSIQKNNSFLQSPVAVSSSSYYTQNAAVSKGDTLLFRMSPDGSGFEDWFDWNPSVTYQSSIPTDGNNTNYTTSSSSDGFVLSARESVMFKGDDFINVQLNRNGSGFSDDVYYVVKITANSGNGTATTQEYTSRLIQGSSTYQSINEPFMGAFAQVPWVSATDECVLTVEAFSHSNVDWHNVEVRPTIQIKAECDDDPIVAYPVAGLSSYNHVVNLVGPVSLNLNSGNYDVHPDINHNPADVEDIFDNIPQGAEQTVYVITKSGGSTLSKRAISFTNAAHSLGNNIWNKAVIETDGSLGGNLPPGYSGDATSVFKSADISGNQVTIEIYGKEGAFSNKAVEYVQQYLSSLSIVNTSNQIVASFSPSQINMFYRNVGIIGTQYKGWGQFAWSGDNSKVIKMVDIKLPGTDAALAQTSPYDENDDFSGNDHLSPWENSFAMMSAVRGENSIVVRSYIENTCVTPKLKDHWAVYGSFMGLYRQGGTTAPGVVGEELDDLNAPVPSTGPYVVPAVKQINKSTTLSVNTGGNVAVPALGGALSYGESESQSVINHDKYYTHTPSSFRDMNGDGYPDIIIESVAGVEIQYTNPGGDHRTATTVVQGEVFNKTISDNKGKSSSGGYLNEDTRFAKLKAQVGASTSENHGESYENIEYVDINGDGLTDRVSHQQGSQLIELNNGEGFEQGYTKTTSYGSYSKGANNSTSFGINGGLIQKLDKGKEYLANSFSAGISVNNVGSESSSLPIDLNGDGLTDLIEVTANDEHFVYINSGTDFILIDQNGSGVDINLARDPNTVQGIGISGNVGGTVAFPLFAFVKMSLSANGGANFAINKMRSSFVDMNGDGSVDFVEAMENGDLRVYFSNVQKSNLLTKVNNPLGGSFEIDYELVGHKTGVHQPIVRTDKLDDAIIWDMPSGKWVMSVLTVNDGVDVPGYDGSDRVKLFFDYDGGIQSRREKAFSGFTRIQTRHQNQLGWESAYPKQYLTEVVEFFAPNDIDFETRNKHDYLKSLVKNNYTLLNKQSNNTANLETTLLSRQTSDYEFRFVDIDESSSNIGEVKKVNGSWKKVNWSLIDETSTVFPAVIGTEAVNYPVKDDRDNYHSQLFELMYDQYFNVVRYQDKGFMSVGTPYEQVVDTIVDIHFEYVQQQHDCSSLGSPDLVDGIANGYIIAGPAGYQADTLWDVPVPTTGDCPGSDPYSIAMCTDVFYSNHKKRMVETHYVTQLVLDAQYTSDRIAILTYEPPTSTVGYRTNALKKHEIYLDNISPSTLKRYSEVTGYSPGGEAMESFKVKLNTGGDFAESEVYYDAYGNVIQVVGAENLNAQRGNVQYSYDNDDHQYLTGVLNHFGETTCSVYDHATGSLLRTVGINGHAMQYEYDDFDRLVKVFAPKELRNPSSGATIEYEYHINQAPSVAVTRHNTDFNTSLPEYTANPIGCAVEDLSGRPALQTNAITSTFVDGNARAIQVKSFKKNNQNGTVQDGFLVSGYQKLNKFGNPIASYEDFLSSASATTFVTGTTLNMVQKDIVYDYQYRQVESKQYSSYALNAGQWLTSSVTYGFTDVLSPGEFEFYTNSTLHSSQALVNPVNDVSTSEIVDSRGRKIGVIQHGQGNDITTQFSFNAIGELQSVTDPIGEVTSYTYDLAGRQLTESHPDRGQSALAYDKASNVISITNPATTVQNGSITLDYNYSRVISKSMPSGGGVNLYDITYSYGMPGDGKNGAGRLTTITQGGTFKVDNLKYDELGQLTEEIKTIDVPNTGSRTFATSYIYDSFGRILRCTYPDADQVDYTYWSSGELSNVSSTVQGATQAIVSEIYYDGRGNISELIYGNGTNTTYEYSTRTQTLVGSEVFGKPVGGTNKLSLLDRTYAYNGQGMISGIDRTMHSSLVQNGETSHSFDFNYDSFNRLEQGDLSISGLSGSMYNVTTTFNDAGGIVSKNSSVSAASATLSANAAQMTYDLTYQYNPSKPHQLEKVVDQQTGDEQVFQYNSTGSIKHITNTQNPAMDEEFFWNEEQWLNAVKNNQGVHHYVYDHSGERIMKSSVLQTVVSVNDNPINTVNELEPYTLYVNPYFVVTEFANADKVSKHYFMGSQRVASELGVQNSFHNPSAPSGGSDSGTKEAHKTSSNNPWLSNLNNALSDFGEPLFTESDLNGELPVIESVYPDLALSTESSFNTESNPVRVLYWYHPDYIGNVDLVTDLNAVAYEFFLYNPWGRACTSGIQDLLAGPHRIGLMEKSLIKKRECIIMEQGITSLNLAFG